MRRARQAASARVACAAMMEVLENRQLLSVGVDTLAGSQAAGVVRDYTVSVAGTPVDQVAQTNKGAATFLGQSVTEVDTVTTTLSNGDVTTTKGYYLLNSSGYQNLGQVDTTLNSSGGTVASDTVTYAPAETLFPALVTGGQTYTSTFTATDVLTVPNSAPTTTTETITQTAELTSETSEPLTVPAGSYNTYLLDLTTVTTPANGTATTATSQEWIAPGVGVVQSTTGTGSTAVSQQLTSFNSGAGTTTISAAITPVVLKTTLPASVVAGGTSHGTAVVSLANTNASTVKENLTIQVFASSDGVIDSTSTVLGTVSKKISIKAGGTVNVLVPIKSVPSSLNGEYSILAETSDSVGITQSTTGPTLLATAPFVAFSEEVLTTNLTGSIVSGSKTKDSVVLKLTNQGNVTSTGNSTVNLLVSPNGTVDSGTTIRTVAVAIVIKPGKSKTVRIALQSLPNVPNGTYGIVAEITDPKGDTTSVGTTTTVSLAQAFLSLIPALGVITPGAHGSGLVLLTVTDQGNIPPTGNSQIILTASPTDTVSSGLQLSSQRAHIAVQPNKSKVLKLHLTASDLNEISSEGLLVVELVDPLGGVQTASTPAVG